MSEIKKVAVIGAGQMGSGIAQVCAQAGAEVLLWDVSDQVLEQAKEGIEKRLNRAVEKEQLTPGEAEGALSRVNTASTFGDFGDCQLAIEAVVENTEVKLQLFQKLDETLPPDAVLTSNTSSISITKIASGTERPERVMGMHFMNPVPVMKLVELIRGLQTSDETYEIVKGFADKLGKTTVLAIDGPGFIVNRILCPMINEAIYLLQEGVSAEDIDTSMKLGTNQPMGPLQLADFVGLDTLHSILKLLHNELGEDKYRPCPLLTKYVEAGWFGRKSGKGFYAY